MKHFPQLIDAKGMGSGRIIRHENHFFDLFVWNNQFQGLNFMSGYFRFCPSAGTTLMFN